MWRAIISSSLVGSTQAATGLAAVLMRGPAGLVGRVVQHHAEPGRGAADALADLGAVLADATGEHQRIEAAQRSGERTQLARDAVDVQIDREPGARLLAGEQRAHVARDARDAEQPGLVVDQLLDGARVHAALVHQVQDDAGVDGAAACAHRQAIDRREAHRARDAAPGQTWRTCWRRCPGAGPRCALWRPAASSCGSRDAMYS